MSENGRATPVALLAGLNARYTHSNPALYSLRAHCRGGGTRVDILEMSVNASPEDIIAGIVSSRAGIIGLSVYIWNARCLRALIPRIKAAAPGCRLVLGGPEVTHSPGDWLSMNEVDIVVAGPGEEAFRKILAGDVPARERLIVGDNPRFADLPFPYEEIGRAHV